MSRFFTVRAVAHRQAKLDKSWAAIAVAKRLQPSIPGPAVRMVAKLGCIEGDPIGKAKDVDNVA